MKKYITKTALLHNNIRYAVGAEILLDDAHAKHIAHCLTEASPAITNPEVTDQMIIEAALSGISDDADSDYNQSEFEPDPEITLDKPKPKVKK